MIAIDTNIVVRMIVEDDPRQARAAFDLLARQQCFITVAAVMETEWVLRSVYRWSRQQIAAALLGLFDLENIAVEAQTLVVWAIERFESGGDLTDMLLIVSGRNTLGFATFEKRLVRQAGPDAPLKVVKID